MLEDIKWHQISWLHISGIDDEIELPDGAQYQIFVDDDSLRVDLRLNKSKSQDIQQYLNRCSKLKLRQLAIKNTNVVEINVGELIKLVRLDLSHNTKLETLQGLGQLTRLEVLDLTGSTLSNLCLTEPIKNLRHFIAGGAMFENADFLTMCPSLVRAYFENAQICRVPSLEGLIWLESLNLKNTPVSSLNGVLFPKHLHYINLSGTLITRLPDAIGNLREMNVLDLSQTILEDLPDWLTGLKLAFSSRSSYGNGHGIYLQNTIVNGVDMSIFDQSQETILQWFEERTRARLEEEVGKPLNELKVVFLGDGGAGKSHTIARLLNDGMQTKDFPNVSTPGIVIKDKTYTINNREVNVHFWDFGGQEILHSMHRMFLTERTLYVVVLNVREGNQDERARYWLHNLRSFADGAPVLLVLNQMDMNKNASVNEADLRKLYPGLTEIVKLSTLEYSRERFVTDFIDVLKAEIAGMNILDYPFTASWRKLKEKLQNMSDNYIFGDDFRRYCDESGVKGSDTVRRDLLNIFGVLGVSFCYSGSMKLEDYVVLRPDWITNAIYIILFNKVEAVKNGQVSHETIYRMLSSKDTENIRRTVTTAAYKPHEVNYVLEVFRKFRLSFWVDEKTEFLPILCDANSTAAATEYENDPKALEFRMHYEYLPNNVIHRLMVDRRRELDLSNVWLAGARFEYPHTALSAVVKTEGNLLRVMVRAEGTVFNPQLYLDILKKDLERINTEMGLEPLSKEVVYKKDGKVVCFDYDDLLYDQEMGETHINSRILKTRISVNEILKLTDQPVDTQRKRLIRSIARSCAMLQDNRKIWDGSEDERTTYLRDLLMASGYTVLDQHLVGTGAGGKQAGELDLDIRLEPDVHWTALEALNLSGSSDSQIDYWNKHLDKLLTSYNAPGRAFLFHVSYLSCPMDKFSAHCVKYRDHMRHYSPKGFSVLSMKDLNVAEREHEPGRFLQAMECVYDCGGVTMTVYHYFVRIGE